jgi:hypothetical protein
MANWKPIIMYMKEIGRVNFLRVGSSTKAQRPKNISKIMKCKIIVEK